MSKFAVKGKITGLTSDVGPAIHDAGGGVSLL